jgi:hypothetical protein
MRCIWQLTLCPKLRAARRPKPPSFAANRYPTHTNITIVTKDNAKRSA